MIIFFGEGGWLIQVSIYFAVQLIEIRANGNYLSKRVKYLKKRIKYVVKNRVLSFLPVLLVNYACPGYQVKVAPANVCGPSEISFNSKSGELP